MSAANLLHLLAERGFRLTVDGATLRVAPAARLDADLRQQIAENKTALLAMLSPPALAPEEQADIEEAVSERAAIREHDGGEARATADAQAASAMRVYRLLVAMDPEQDPRWITMLAPNTDLAEAERTARLKFGTRLLRIVPNAPPARPDTVSGASAGPAPCPTSTSPTSAQSPSDGLLAPAITTEK